MFGRKEWGNTLHVDRFRLQFGSSLDSSRLLCGHYYTYVLHWLFNAFCACITRVSNAAAAMNPCEFSLRYASQVPPQQEKALNWSRVQERHCCDLLWSVFQRLLGLTVTKPID